MKIWRVEFCKATSSTVLTLELFCFRRVLKRKYSGFYFRLKEVRILYNFCTHCNLKSANSVLAEIAKSTNTSGFCLTHLFTYLDIPGIAGLAFHSKPNRIALCYPDANTGFTTFLNHQVTILS